MSIESIQESLVALNQYEKLGKAYAAKHGTPLSYWQYIYILSTGNMDPDELNSPKAVVEQQRILEEMRSRTAHHILGPGDFMPGDRNIEIEKLLRWVDIPEHQHDFLECAYVVCGQCIHRINGADHIQGPGTFVAIPPTFTHALFPEDDCLCLTIKIRNEFLQSLNIPRLLDFLYPLSFSCGDDEFVRNTIAALWEQQESGLPYFEQIMEQLFQTLMLYIEQRFHVEVQFLTGKAVRDKRILEILSFMMDNYSTITLQSVARQFHYNPAYLSRIFHEQTGLTFSATLKEYKLRRAAKLLIETDRKLGDICAEVGYGDVTQFSRSFRELFGSTPSKYRKDLK